MARAKGLAAFSANFEPQLAEPLDARMRVPTYAELVLTATWTASDSNVYAYKGMLVSVYNDPSPVLNGLYFLSDADYTVAANWIPSGAIKDYAKIDASGNVIPTEVGAALGTPSLVWDNLHTSAVNVANVASLPSGQLPGEITWNEDLGTINIPTIIDGAILQPGHETVTLVRNISGINIVNGDVVRVTGATGTKPRVELARSDSSLNLDGILGVATVDIPTGSFGYITTFGTVNDIDTHLFAEGDTVYLSSTNFGKLTNVCPVSPAFCVKIGIVTVSGVGNGALSVRLDSNVELNLHERDTTNPHETTYAQAVADIAPNGLVTSTDWAVSYNPTLRQFTVVLSVPTDITVAGIRATVAAGTYTTTAHANTSGVYFLQVNSAGALSVSASFTFNSSAIVAYSYYNATTAAGVLWDERHPSISGWSSTLHRYLHQTKGAQLISGGILSGYTLGDNTTAAMQFAIDQTVFDDESYRHTLVALADNGTYTYWYRSGADSAGEWSWVTGATLPFPVTGADFQYNQNNAGTWQLTSVTVANRWVNMWVIATNSYGGGAHRFLTVVGQAAYTSLADAQEESFLTSISWGTLPFQEIVPLARITVQFNNTAGNDFNYAQVTEIRGTDAALTSTVSPTSHGSLSGRSDSGAHPASAVSYDGTTSLLVATNVQAAIDEEDARVDTHIGLTSTAHGGIAALSDTNPVMNGTAAPGNGTTASRTNHIHPTDTSRAASTHASQHKSGGSDTIKLDECAAPTDVTTLNATVSAHGLLPKLGGGTSNYLRADGTWAAPAGGVSEAPIDGNEYVRKDASWVTSNGASVFRDLAGLTRLSSSTFGGTGLLSTVKEGWLVRYAVGTVRPTLSTSWNYGFVQYVTDTVVTIIGALIPVVGADTLYVEYDLYGKALESYESAIPGMWSLTASEDDLLTRAGLPCLWTQGPSRFIGAIKLFSTVNDSGVQPTINIVIGGNDFMTANKTISLLPVPDGIRDAATSTGVNTSVDVVYGTQVSIVCRSTGTGTTKSQNLQFKLLFARL